MTSPGSQSDSECLLLTCVEEGMGTDIVTEQNNFFASSVHEYLNGEGVIWRVPSWLCFFIFPAVSLSFSEDLSYTYYSPDIFLGTVTIEFNMTHSSASRNTLLCVIPQIIIQPY